MTLQETISSLLDNDQMEVDPQWVEEIGEKYPYFTLPMSLLLRRNNSIGGEVKEKMVQRLALNTADRDSLSMVVGPDGDLWAHFYPLDERKQTVSTNEAINTFLDNYGSGSAKEEALLERLIFNPTPDYAQLLAEEEERSVPKHEDLSARDSQDALINAFIIKSREQQGHFPAISEDLIAEPKPVEQTPDTTPVSSPEVSADDSMLSESLAKIYIKQRKYSKAYEIIRNLSLNFPEKSIYFADQLRFLQKLIINQRYIDQNKAKKG